MTELDELLARYLGTAAVQRLIAGARVVFEDACEAREPGDRQLEAARRLLSVGIVHETDAEHRYRGWKSPCAGGPGERAAVLVHRHGELGASGQSSKEDWNRAWQ